MPQHGVNSEQIRGKISEHITQHIHRLPQGSIGPCIVEFVVLSRFALSERADIEARQHYKRVLPHTDVRSSERCTTDLCGAKGSKERLRALYLCGPMWLYIIGKMAGWTVAGRSLQRRRSLVVRCLLWIIRINKYSVHSKPKEREITFFFW
jgi:hypothetical protein